MRFEKFEGWLYKFWWRDVSHTSDLNQGGLIWALCVVTWWIFLDKKLFLMLPLPSRVFNFVFKSSITLGAIMKWWLAFHWVEVEKCWAKFLMMLCAAQTKIQFKFLLCRPHWLVLTLQAPRVSKVNFLLTKSVQCINKREGYENKQNDHLEEKSFISCINKFSLIIL